MNKPAVTITLMICIVVLAALALMKCIYRALLTGCMTALAGLGGYTLGKRLPKPEAQSKDSASKPDNPSGTP